MVMQKFEEWSKEELLAIEQAQRERLGGLLHPSESIIVTGTTSVRQIRACCVIQGAPTGDRVELEALIDPVKVGLEPDDARDLILDAIDLVLLEYLESGRTVRFSGVLEERELRGRQLLMRVERTFPALDAEADKLLKDSAD